MPRKQPHTSTAESADTVTTDLGTNRESADPRHQLTCVSETMVLVMLVPMFAPMIIGIQVRTCRTEAKTITSIHCCVSALRFLLLQNIFFKIDFSIVRYTQMRQI